MPRLFVLLALMVCLAIAGCGGGGSGDDAGTQTTTPAAVDVKFPSGKSKTLRGLRDQLPEGAIFAPAVSVLDKGDNRVGFALFDAGRKQVTPEAVALYFADSDKRRLQGPFVARRESLAVKPQFQSRQTAADAKDVNSFWVADVPFPKNGRYVFAALAQVGGKMITTSQFELRVGAGQSSPPNVGDKAISIHTDTPADVGGDLAKIDTRLPPLRAMHEKDFADVVGKEPVVLVFATPQLCQTRVCGPVVDIAAEVQARTKGVTFIHQEIYNENRIDAGFRQQVGAWRLPTEPWTFVIGKDGRIVQRFEGALSVQELEGAVRKVGQVG
jgi:hypothetical protein